MKIDWGFSIYQLPSLYYRRARMYDYNVEISARTVSCQPDASTENYKHHYKRTLYEGEVSQAQAKKLLWTSRGEPLEHADRKYCNFTIRKYFQKLLRCLLACSQIWTKRWFSTHTHKHPSRPANRLAYLIAEEDVCMCVFDREIEPETWN